MKRTLLIAGTLAVLLFIVFSAAPSSAFAWGPCDGPYGGYAGCSGAGYYSGGYSGGYYGGYYGGYSGGWVYNRVCWYGNYGRVYCSYVRVPAWPVSGYYGYIY